MGMAYISILPVFEGFDETAHFSSLRQIANTGTIPIHGKGFLDRFILEFQGPLPYDSGTPPFDQGVVYASFFKDPELVDLYIQKYRQPFPLPPYYPSQVPNWQAQHPPLYYLLLAPLINIVDGFSFTAQFFLLRSISFLLALSGVALGIKAVFQASDATERNIALFGFVFYPVVLPMFFPEFARIGNDSLCIFLVGMIAYLLSRWLEDEYSINKSIPVGVALGMGLLTKAFFLPVASALTVFLLLKAWMNRQGRSKYLRSLFSILLPMLLIGGSWYIYNLVHFGTFTGSSESLTLSSAGGLFTGLNRHFSWINFIRGLIAPIASFIWAGTWSLVRLPDLFHLPLMMLTLSIMIAYVVQIIPRRSDHPVWLPVWMFIFFGAGLFWHILVGIAINGNAATPGWYLHILMPWTAPALGLGLVSILRNSRLRILTILLLSYAMLYHLAVLWSQFALFTGCASKGPDKYYVFSGNFFCLDQISILMDRASILGYPALGIVGFLGWIFANLWLLKQIWEIKITITQ